MRKEDLCPDNKHFWIRISDIEQKCQLCERRRDVALPTQEEWEALTHDISLDYPPYSRPNRVVEKGAEILALANHYKGVTEILAKRIVRIEAQLRIFCVPLPKDLIED